MGYSKIIKIALIFFFIFFLGIIIFFLKTGFMQSPEGYNATDQEIFFIKKINKKTRLEFIYTNRHHDSITQNIDIYDRNDSLSKVTFLNKLNIKKFSDSTFYEFMKVYNQKKDIDALKMKFHLSKIDTAFVYKVENK